MRFHPKPVVHLAALLPFAWLLARTLRGELGPDPVAQLTHATGDWALRFLLLALAITPLRKLTGWSGLIRFRRMIGLYAFFYTSLHLSVYLALDLGGFWRQIFEEIAKRPYITVGFLAWLILLTLAATSTQAAIRRLKRNWVRLHRLVYAAGALAVLHFWWLVKADVREPGIYAAILTVLLVARLPIGKKPRRPGD
jgi:sulfoxide reductase heme-binding subunit YedZ